jgi:hypothetical protein
MVLRTPRSSRPLEECRYRPHGMTVPSRQHRQNCGGCEKSSGSEPKYYCLSMQPGKSWYRHAWLIHFGMLVCWSSRTPIALTCQQGMANIIDNQQFLGHNTLRARMERKGKGPSARGIPPVREVSRERPRSADVERDWWEDTDAIIMPKAKHMRRRKTFCALTPTCNRVVAF